MTYLELYLCSLDNILDVSGTISVFIGYIRDVSGTISVFIG